jgi:hypothetical protein
VVDFSEYYNPRRSSGWFPERNKLAQTRFSVSTLVGIVESVPSGTFSFTNRVTALEWRLRALLGKVQGARNTSTEQKGREEQTRLIDLDDSVGATYCP